MGPRYVLTLVHGTWANTQGWVGAGSYLRRELERRLAPVTFRAFSWTGANTHAARIEGGVRLAQFIRDGHAEHPAALHFVVAHSHGANVALYSMRDPAARDVLRGIVTLGAPFIYTRRRNLPRYADVIAWLLLSISALMTFGLLDALRVPHVGLAWLVVAMIFVPRLSPPLARWVLDIATREQTDIVAMHEPPKVDPSTLAILCTRRDEARGWLYTWDTLARVPFIVACVLFSVMEIAARTNLPSALDGMAGTIFNSGLGDFRILGVDGWWLVVGGLVSCAICGVMLLGSGIVLWPGYWKGSLLTNLLVEVGSARVPQDDVTPHALREFNVPATKWTWHIGQLRHSAICADEAVVRSVGDWISARGLPRGRSPHGAAPPPRAIDELRHLRRALC